MKITDRNIRKYKRIITPKEMKERFPSEYNSRILGFRKEIENILSKKSNRIMIIVGPCSIHNTSEAYEYALKLSELSKIVSNKIFIIMRTYFEKPRTILGWKGFIHDPHLDGTNDIESGLISSRKLLIDIAKLGVPCATEFLNNISPQFMDDLISWAAIGARTTESQTHREMASGMSMPVGFKNDTNGNHETAINAIKSALEPHSFLGIDDNGNNAIVHTYGNKYSHLILRGGEFKGKYITNYKDAKSISDLMNDNNLLSSIIIDCSHANSEKNHLKQIDVFKEVISEVAKSNEKYISGLMLESNLFEGNQKLTNENRLELSKGVSITDSCISWEMTKKLILSAYELL